jgi:hypothetical protein
MSNIGSGGNGIRRLIKATLPGPNLCKYFMLILNMTLTIWDKITPNGTMDYITTFEIGNPHIGYDSFFKEYIGPRKQFEHIHEQLVGIVTKEA